MTCSPAQLIAHDSDELWRMHLVRDFPLFQPPSSATSHSAPSRPSHDHKSLYFLAKAQRAAALTSAAARLRERTQANREEKGKRKAVFSEVDLRAAQGKKKRRNGWGAPAAAPKTMVEKAKDQTRRITQMHSASNPSSSFRKPHLGATTSASTSSPHQPTLLSPLPSSYSTSSRASTEPGASSCPPTSTADPFPGFPAAGSTVQTKTVKPKPIRRGLSKSEAATNTAPTSRPASATFEAYVKAPPAPSVPPAAISKPNGPSLFIPKKKPVPSPSTAAKSKAPAPGESSLPWKAAVDMRRPPAIKTGSAPWGGPRR